MKSTLNKDKNTRTNRPEQIANNSVQKKTTIFLFLKKIIFIAPPDHFTDWINDVAKLIGINQKIIDITLEKFKKDYDMNPYEMSVSRWIKNVNNIEGLIIHGEKDKIVPFNMGKKVFLEANEPKYSYFPKEDDHMMEYNENLLEALNKFLKSI